MKPVSDVRLCPMANPAYHKRDCLIAPVKCLRWLSNEYGKPEDCCCLKLAHNAFWVSPGDNLYNDYTNCLIVSRNKVPCCGKQVQKFSKNDSNENNTPPPIRGAIRFGTRKLHKSGLLNSNSSTLGQSPSSETQATNLVVIGDNSVASSVDGSSQQAVPQKMRKRLLRRLLAARDR